MTMFTVTIASVILLMIAVLLAPSKTDAVILVRVPKEARPNSSRLAIVPVVTIFVLGALMFDSIPSLTQPVSPQIDPVQQALHPVAGLLLLGLGVFAALWPESCTRLFVRGLRLGRASGTIGGSYPVLLTSRFFGAVFIVAAAFILRGWFR